MSTSDDSIKLATLVLELAEAVDNAAEDIGGSRPQLDILREAVQVAERLEKSSTNSAAPQAETPGVSDSQVGAVTPSLPPAEAALQTPRTEDIEWMHRFINCAVFSPPPSECLRAHLIVDELAAVKADLTKALVNHAADLSAKPARDEEAVGMAKWSIGHLPKTAFAKVSRAYLRAVGESDE